MKANLKNAVRNLSIALCLAFACQAQAQENQEEKGPLGIIDRSEDQNVMSWHMSEYLGLSAATNRYGGLRISGVRFNSIGYSMGLEKGDVIYRAGGRQIGHLGDLEEAVRQSRGSLWLDVRNVRTGRREYFRARTPQVGNPVAQYPELGITGELLPDGRSVKVESVDRWGLAGQMGLQQGDILKSVNGFAVQQIQDFARVMQDRVQLNFYRPSWGQHMTVTQYRGGWSPDDFEYDPWGNGLGSAQGQSAGNQRDKD